MSPTKPLHSSRPCPKPQQQQQLCPPLPAYMSSSSLLISACTCARARSTPGHVRIRSMAPVGTDVGLKQMGRHRRSTPPSLPSVAAHRRCPKLTHILTPPPSTHRRPYAGRGWGGGRPASLGSAAPATLGFNRRAAHRRARGPPAGRRRRAIAWSCCRSSCRSCRSSWKPPRRYRRRRRRRRRRRHRHRAVPWLPVVSGATAPRRCLSGKS